MDGKSSAVVTISKMTTVDEFRKMVQEELEVAPELQRLFFRGKQVCMLDMLHRIYNMWYKTAFQHSFMITYGHMEQLNCIKSPIRHCACYVTFRFLRTCFTPPDLTDKAKSSETTIS